MACSKIRFKCFLVLRKKPLNTLFENTCFIRIPFPLLVFSRQKDLADLSQQPLGQIYALTHLPPLRKHSWACAPACTQASAPAIGSWPLPSFSGKKRAQRLMSDAKHRCHTAASLIPASDSLRRPRKGFHPALWPGFFLGRCFRPTPAKHGPGRFRSPLRIRRVDACGRAHQTARCQGIDAWVCTAGLACEIS